MSEETFTYICRSRQCGCVFMLAVDRPEYAGDTAEFLFSAVINGLYIERVPSEQVKTIENLLSCPHDTLAEKVQPTVWMCSIHDEDTETHLIEAVSPQEAAEEYIESYIADYDEFYGDENDDNYWEVLTVSDRDRRYIVKVTRHRAEAFTSSVEIDTPENQLRMEI